jgi:DNA-binding transcriptional MerR regulator
MSTISDTNDTCPNESELADIRNLVYLGPMSDPDKLTPKQAANHLGVNPRTLRRWSVAFSKSLSESARKTGRKRGYTSDDISRLEQARDLLAEGKTIKEVAELLPPAEQSSTASALILAPEANIALGQALERTKHLGYVTEDHEDRIKLLESKIKRLRWERLPWWKKIRTPPPD